jgi:hypothetical protein
MKVPALICTSLIIASCAFAQTAPTAQAPAAGGGFQRPAMTAEQQAAAKERAEAQDADHQNMMDQLHIKTLRPGRSGTAGQPNYANYDEAKANPYPNLPDPLVFKNGKKVVTAKDWWKRRDEIKEDFDREVYGRVPKNVPGVTWTVVKDTLETVSEILVKSKRIVGHVDNSLYPQETVDIQVTLSTPANAQGPVPVIMQFGGNGYPSPAGTVTRGFGGGAPGGAARTPVKSPKQQLIEKGWGYATINPGSIQADNGAGLTHGIIGLVNQGAYRKPDDWGALRAWAWGADRAMDYFETDPAVNAKEVGLEGHSRYGKATIVSMAYDQRFAIAYISSSGEGGIKLSRRDAGEVVENLTGTGEYHWMAGNWLKYGGPLNWGDLPVDAHELAAMCAPRPIFVSAGSGGDGWQDAQGMFMGAAGANPVYELLGKKGLGTTTMPKAEVMLNGDIAFRRHLEGHTDVPNWPFFITYAAQYFK